MTLLELIVGAGIMGFLFLAASQFMLLMTGFSRASNVLVHRNQIVNLIKSYAVTRESILTSAQPFAVADPMDGNGNLSRCFDEQDPAVDLTDCETDSFLEFSLFPPLNFSQFAPGAIGQKDRVTGTFNQPKYYDMDGFACPASDTLGTRCPIRVVTEVRPQCGPDMTVSTIYGTYAVFTTCKGFPEIVVTYYEVDLNPNLDAVLKEQVKAMAPVRGTVAVEFK